MKKILPLLLWFFALPALAQTGAVNRFCDLGASNATTSGMKSANFQQGLIPRCTVAVYLHGTTTYAPIFAQSGSTSGLNSVTVTSGGTYSACPTGVVFTGGGGGSGAVATVTCVGTAISTVTLTSPGSGYTSAPTVSFTGGAGSGGAATAVMTGDLANPFTANNDASYLFFSAVNQGLDITMSGGTPPNTYPQPRTVVDVYPTQSLNPIGGVTSIIPGPGLSVNTPTGAVTVGCQTASASQIGCSEPDNTTILANPSGVYSCATATTSLLGCMRPDGTTITIAGGVISATPAGSGINQLTGDVTAGPGSGSQAATLATVNSAPGTCGDAQHICQLTDNAKGLVTSQSQLPVSIVNALAMSVAPPVAGQYATVPASTCNTTISGPGSAVCSADNSGVSMAIGPAVGPVNPASVSVTFGFALPSYVTQASITAAYATGYSSHGGAALMTASLQCSGTSPSVGPVYISPVPGGGGTNYPFQSVTNLFSTVPTVANVTCTATIGASIGGATGVFNASGVSLLLYYTGTPPPATTPVKAYAPINYTPDSLSIVFPYDLGVDTASTNTYNVSIPAYAGPLGQNPFAGETAKLIVSNGNTSTTPTLAINGGYPYTIVGQRGGALSAGDISSSIVANLIFDNNNEWELQNPQVTTFSSPVPTVVDTTSTVTVSATNPSELHFNENATAAQAVTYNLVTAAAGKQFCFTNSNNGTAPDTGVLTIAASASGQFIIFTDGTLSASGGNVTSGGAAADAACVAGVDATHWMLYVQRGTWAKH